MNRLAWIPTFLLMAGCSTIPFEPPPKADYRSVDPQGVVDGFDQSVAHDFELLESVVFRFFGKEMTGMGYLAVDAGKDSFALSCMTPAGIKLFEFKGVGDEVETLFVPPQLDKHQGRFAESVAQDIRRIYLGWTPSENAALKRGKHRLRYREKIGDVQVEHVFEGPEHTLARKEFSKGWRTQTVIRYFDYREVDGKLYPYGIVLENKRYRYRLILRIKSVQSVD
jgi:hypothetical protein